MDNESRSDVLDVAVVGAGVSGLYSAWRLLAHDGKQRITVFEGSKRTGGRLVSVTPPGMPNVKCELGGMRYMSTQPLIKGLVEKKLKLPTHPLPVSEPENIAYLRGHHLRLKDLNDTHKLPYNLSWAERGRTPDELLAYAIDQLIPGVTDLRGEALWNVLKNFKVNGQHIYDHGFWNLLALSLSREAYELAQQTGGYDVVMQNWNAADTITLNFDFAPDVQFSALDGGYELVPEKIREQFVAAGGSVELERRLKSFDRVTLPDGSVGVALRFAGQSQPVLARSLILAMPRRSLELLDQTGAVLDAANTDVQRLIASVVPIPLFKLCVCYHEPWWETVGVTKGRTVTDLPIRQCYYWAVESAQEKGAVDNHNSVIMVYDDSLSVDFWGGLRSVSDQPVYEARPNRFADAFPAVDHWNDYKAPAPMVHEVHRQLVEIHGLRTAPLPYAAAYRDWGEDPYGGGVNFWAIHAKSWEVIPAIAKPKRDVPVYITGEAYSNGQGWVEGALETAELVLQTYYKLPPPAWTEGA